MGDVGPCTGFATQECFSGLLPRSLWKFSKNEGGAWRLPGTEYSRATPVRYPLFPLSRPGNLLIFLIEAAVMLMSSRRGRARHDYHVERLRELRGYHLGWQTQLLSAKQTLTQLGDE